MSPAEKKLFIRQADVYAAYLAYTDEQIGRVIDAVEEMGKLDNTLIIYISGDNGASVEGTLNGSPNEVLFFNQKELSVERQLPFIPKWGSDETYPHMAAGWAWAFDTPYKWTKQVASHFGGTRQGMCISWPRGIKKDVHGGIRDQFHHLIDIVPTILQVVGVEAPKVVDGIAQKDMDGVSMAYTFSAQGATTPSHRKTQYFEEQGLHGIYHEGWYACTTPIRAPWSVQLNPREIKLNPAFAYTWELYNLDNDWTQANNLLACEPENKEVKAKLEEKLKQLQRIFMQEANKYQVLPLDANTPKLLMNTARPTLTGDRTEFVYTRRLTGVPLAACSPNVLASSFTITAAFEIREHDRGEGVLAAQGGRFAGWSLFLLHGKPVFTFNRYGLTWVRWVGNETIGPGDHTIVFDFQLDRTGFRGTGTLTVDGKEPVIKDMAPTIPTTLQWDESFDIGSDIVTSVCPQDYTSPFEFTGAIRKIKIELSEQDDRQPVTYRQLMQDTLIEADYWTSQPCILAVGLGFTRINGTVGVALPQQELAIAAVRRNGGAWNTIHAAVAPDDVPLRAYTSAISPLGMRQAFGVAAPNTDGTPMELSWPVLPSTVQPEDILVTLNNGEKKHPVSISVMPNFEYNERTTLVMNGDCFGNRLDPKTPGAIYPVKFEIVDDGTPMKLVGPGGRIVSAVGLSFETGQPLTAYGEGNGPRLCAAKLTRIADGLRGEGGPSSLGGNFLPNDGVRLYGRDAQFRLRLLTTGGFSPDGVRSLYPDEFENFFRLKVLVDDEPGEVIWIEKSGRLVRIGRHGTIEVVGLADLGQRRERYDDTYLEDHDNQIDIILKGDEAAMRRIVAVHHPAKMNYRFYNPGGPGNDPFPEVTYSAAGPKWLQPVTIAIDDPMQVTYRRKR